MLNARHRTTAVERTQVSSEIVSKSAWFLLFEPAFNNPSIS